MQISIRKPIFEQMTDDELRNVERRAADIKGIQALDINLLDLDGPHLDRLRTALQRLHAEKKANTQSLVNDIDRWLKLVREGADGNERPRNVRQFADLMTQYIATSPGHRIYERQSDGEWLAYYVNHVDYERERSGRESYRPARTQINLLYWRLGTLHSYSMHFSQSDIDGRTVAETMANHRLSIETPDLRDQYLEQKSRFEAVFNDVGRQFVAQGPGYELKRTAANRRVRLAPENETAKVVVDIVGDTGENTGYGPERVRPYFWSSNRPKANQQAKSDELSVNDAIIDGRPAKENTHDPEIPIHPYVPVYHLSRHKRFRVNVSALEEYRFNQQLGDQLVLPEITKQLVNTLISQGKVSFRDIVDGKGDGACIMLGGPPGTGKTLTAEVFAEATERPLLSVQAAQLGTNPDDIEQDLQRVLERGSRWNAVVLLDEADVYIAERGGDINQNAVVAAFLRALENHTATIFLTTNRLDTVDDAIASRCLARIDYCMPTPDDQRKIWRVLTDDVIENIVDRHDDLSGRDIKQLLKLATLWAAGKDEAVTAATVDFAATFMPARSATTNTKQKPELATDQ